MSNWTELDIWEYIMYEQIPLVPLYYAKKRKIVRKNNLIIPLDYWDIFNRANKHTYSTAEVEEVSCRYRSLGCSPCTGAIESEASTIQLIVEELKLTKKSERQNRAIDNTSNFSMEKKKKEGYF